MEPRRLILASTSPRRKSLLAEFGYVFEVATAEVEELSDASMDPARLVESNAQIKTRPVASLHPDCVVLGADTVVAFGSRIFGKPASMAEAAEMLEQLNGREHSVFSGVCLRHEASGTERVFVERTSVRFHRLDPGQRLAYLARIHPLDKAGAYAAQDDRGELIAGFDGSFSNVIGLPMEALASHLEAFHIRPTALNPSANP